jgi:hypothetical protein
MKHAIFALCVLFAGFAATAKAQVQALPPAQAPGSFTIKCNPTLVTYQFTATQTVSAYACTTDAMINGVAINGLTFSQTNISTPSETQNWGVIVGSLINGDLVFFQYQALARKTSAVTDAATMSYKIVGGTGIANGISGSGTCKAVGAVGQGTEQACVGAYVIR